MEEYESQPKLISQYNEALFKIGRLNQIWIDARKAREAANMLKLKLILESAETELTESAEFVDKRDDRKGKESYVYKIKEINERISKARKMEEYYALFKEKELLLRKIQEEAGMGVKKKLEEDDTM